MNGRSSFCTNARRAIRACRPSSAHRVGTVPSIKTSHGSQTMTQGSPLPSASLRKKPPSTSTLRHAPNTGVNEPDSTEADCPSGHRSSSLQDAFPLPRHVSVSCTESAASPPLHSLLHRYRILSAQCGTTSDTAVSTPIATAPLPLLTSPGSAPESLSRLLYHTLTASCETPRDRKCDAFTSEVPEFRDSGVEIPRARASGFRALPSLFLPFRTDARTGSPHAGQKVSIGENPQQSVA